MSINCHCFENMSVPMRCKECACIRSTPPPSTVPPEGTINTAERPSKILSIKNRDIVIIDIPHHEVTSLVDFDDVTDIDIHMVSYHEKVIKYIYVTDHHGLFSPLHVTEVIGKDISLALPKYWYALLNPYYTGMLTKGTIFKKVVMKPGMMRLLHTFPIRDRCDNIIGGILMLIPPSPLFQTEVEEVNEPVTPRLASDYEDDVVDVFVPPATQTMP